MYIEPDLDLRDVNIREVYSSLERQFGLKALLVRTNKLTRCKCFNVLNSDGDSDCKICGGTGKLSMIEQVKTVYQNVTTKEYMTMTELGMSAINTIVFYFDNKIAPRVQDRIFVVGYDQYGLPIDIKKSCTIASVQQIRGDNGRLELYKVYAKYTPEKIKQDQRRLNSIPPSDKLRIIKGVRYTWPQ